MPTNGKITNQEPNLGYEDRLERVVDMFNEGFAEIKELLATLYGAINDTGDILDGIAEHVGFDVEEFMEQKQINDENYRESASQELFRFTEGEPKVSDDGDDGEDDEDEDDEDDEELEELDFDEEDNEDDE